MKKCGACGFEGEYINHFCEGPPPVMSADGKYIYVNPFSIYPCHRDNPKRQMIVNARARSRRSGLEFRISEDDIVIPEVCPVLGIPLVVGRHKQPSDNSPSLDRMDNLRGYTPDNVCVISWRANSLKGNATVEEVEKILAYMRRL